jgi:hypothetical protein
MDAKIHLIDNFSTELFLVAATKQITTKEFTAERVNTNE